MQTKNRKNRKKVDPESAPQSTQNRPQNRSCAARWCGIGGWGGRGGWGARKSLEGVRGAPSGSISGGEAPPARSGQKPCGDPFRGKSSRPCRRWRLHRLIRGPGQLMNRRERGLGRRAGPHRRVRRLPDHTPREGGAAGDRQLRGQQRVEQPSRARHHLPSARG